MSHNHSAPESINDVRKPAESRGNGEISLFDVKELYDLAYMEKEKARVNLAKFRSLMAKAILLDKAYRNQLMASQSARYEKTFGKAPTNEQAA